MAQDFTVTHGSGSGSVSGTVATSEGSDLAEGVASVEAVGMVVDVAEGIASLDSYKHLSPTNHPTESEVRVYSGI